MHKPARTRMGRTMAGGLSRTSGISRVRSPKKTEGPARGAAGEAEGRERHVPAEAAELLELGRAGAVLDRAGAQEEAALVHGVVDHVEDAPGDAERDGRADAVDHVADLADGVVREEPLEALLH